MITPVALMTGCRVPRAVISSQRAASSANSASDGRAIAQDRLLTRIRQDGARRLNGQGMALGRAGRGQGFRNQQPIDAG